MTRYADPNVCPGCAGLLTPGVRSCPTCGLDLSDDLAQELFTTLTTADRLLARMQQRRAAPATATPATTATTAPFAAGPEGHEGPPASPVSADPARGSNDGPRGTSPESGLRPSAVPKILLSLGAICLLAAAVVFLVVTWSSLGVGGRTAILLAFTVAMAALTTWSARRGFRGAVEALGLVSIGLLALDLAGAESAGWFGTPSDSAFAMTCGLVLVAVGVLASWASRRTPAGAFVGAEVVAVISALVALVSSAGLTWGDPVLRLAVALLALGGTVALAHALGVAGAAVGIAAVSAVGWLALLVTAIGEASADGNLTLDSVWDDGGFVGLLVTAALALLVAVPPGVPQSIRTTAAAGASVALAAPLLLPASDDDVEVALALALGVVLVASATLIQLTRVARAWAPAALGLLGLAAAALGLAVLGWVLRGIDGYTRTAGYLWTGTPGGPVDAASPLAWVASAWMLPAAVLTLTLGAAACVRLVEPQPSEQPGLPVPDGSTTATTPSAARFAAPSAGRSVALGTSLAAASVPVAALGYPVPVWTVLLALLAAAILAATTLPRLVPRRETPPGRLLVPLVVGLLLAAAQPLSWYDETLTAACLLVTLALLAVAHQAVRHAHVAAAAGVGAVAALAGLAWTLGALTDRPEQITALVATGVLGLVALGRGSLPGSDGLPRATVEGACAVAALPLLALGADAADRPASWAAVHLTVLGVVAVALSLLRPDRRPVAALGAVLLAAATWLRLADLGVSEPEPYTLPSALALTAVGLWQMRRRPELSTRVALGPGLTLALLPSLLWVLADEDTDLRVLLLGLACLGLVLVGAVLRWSAPLVLGAVVGAVVTVRESAPYVDAAVPRWSLLALAGAVLVVVALTWEARMADARRASTYLGRLR